VEQGTEGVAVVESIIERDPSSSTGENLCAMPHDTVRACISAEPGREVVGVPGPTSWAFLIASLRKRSALPS
ncbi:hypothetical protein PENTCL1PPCAC_3654, partial [Pristionchus entomophagus]